VVCSVFTEEAMPPSSHLSGRESLTASVNPRPLMSRPAFVIPLSFAMAAVAALLAERLAPPRLADLAAVCAAWIAFYPIPRLKPKIPWWWPWVQGVFIVLGFWLVTRSPS